MATEKADSYIFPVNCAMSIKRLFPLCWGELNLHLLRDFVRAAQIIYWTCLLSINLSFFMQTQMALPPAKLSVCLLGLLVKVRKATVTLVVSVCLSVRPYGTSRLPLDLFSLNLIPECFFRKFVKKIKVSFESDKNNGYFTWIMGTLH
jgi:hypothetical protein